MDDPSIAEQEVDPSPTSPGTTPSPPAAVRAQLLATEHWGLLASRSTTQAELLTRIAIFLTLVSAGLVSIGLLGQVTRFADWFPVAALAVLAFLSIVGLITQMRVINASEEDMMYVVAMNRLRGAYVDLDPDVERYFLASANDDEEGLDVTYSFLRRRSLTHLLGSSAMLIVVVTAVLVGLLAGGIVAATGGSRGAATAVGVGVSVLDVVGAWTIGAWTYTVAWRNHVPLRRSTGTRRTGVRVPGGPGTHPGL